MSVLIRETQTERQLIEAVQLELRNRIEATSVEDVASLLDLHPEGVRSLLLREWPLQKAFRVAGALDFDLATTL